MKHLLSGFLLLVSMSLLAQQSYTYEQTFSWLPEPVAIQLAEDDTRYFLQFERASLDATTDYLPVFKERIPLPHFGALSIELTTVATEVVDNYRGVDVSAVKDAFGLQVEMGVEKKQPFAYVSILPLRRNPQTGLLERATAIAYTIKQGAPRSARMAGQRSGAAYAANSVLASGTWYKLITRNNGIHRLGYSDLESLGIDVANIDPRNLQLYGNGGGMLPEKNSISRQDDLTENAIRIVGESDGSFDQNDYILFYGTSAIQYAIDTVSVSGQPTPIFRQQQHLYDDKAVYFLTVGDSPGKRVTTTPSAGAPTYTTSTYSYVTHYEQELVNPSESGRMWYGEKFDFAQTSRVFDFSIPQIDGSQPALVTTGLIARSIAGSTAFSARVNGQSLFNTSFGTVGIQYYADFAREDYRTSVFSAPANNLQLQLSFSPSGADPESAGWLDYITINARRSIQPTNGQVVFTDFNSVAPGQVTQFNLAGNGLTVWDITEQTDARQMTLSAGNFTVDTDILRRFVAFDGSSFFQPELGGTVPNQNYHGTIGQPDVVIIAPALFLPAANRLADFHRQHDGYQVAVVALDKLYNEFSSGVKDITAIRDVMRMLYERATTPEAMPEHLILFGDGSYDYKNIQIAEANNHNFIPTYQSYESLDRDVTFTSDDYFGMLDPHEGTDIMRGAQLLDIGVGRLVATSIEQAEAIVDKIIHYHEPTSLGSWRNTISFVADDEDRNTHINDAELISATVERDFPVYNVDKIYFDAFEQVSTPGGSRYPQVNAAINSRLFSGALVMNYTGHGGEAGWAHEKVLTLDEINSWSNYDRLPLFVTATCSFTRYDNPQRKSGGELLLTKADGGAIALVTTVRLVYSNANREINLALFDTLLSPVNGKYQTLGAVMMHAKNSISGGANNRKFALIGDPAMTLGYPRGGVKTTTFKKEPFITNGDTLQALDKVEIGGVVLNQQGQLMDDFNGVVYPTIFDKSETVRTLANDPQSNKRNFNLQKNIIYRGKASVSGGAFTFTFIVPKDINYNYGSGKLSYYAEDGAFDANGYDSIIIGGSADSFAIDEQGPIVKVYMNDEKFVFGGTTDENPVMLVKLSDESGINTAGSAIGHDIAAVLDEAITDKIILNEFYESALDDYTQGEVRYPLSNMASGTHEVRVKAWDVHNNSGEGYTEFVVAESAELALSHVLNYPNPFTTQTSFWFEHNRPGEPLLVTVQIFTVSGIVVKTIQQQITTAGYRVDNIQWNGLDEYGDEIGKGAYVYKVSVVAPDGEQAHAYEKLVLLR